MVALAASRLRAAHRRGQFPKWLVRVARCMAPGTCSKVRSLKGGGVVYVIWSPAGVYIGKASMARATGPGVAQRCAEHVRLLLRPGNRDSNKKRH
eukprot:6553170-Pyramimonas_sp.AAC.1